MSDASLGPGSRCSLCSEVMQAPQMLPCKQLHSKGQSSLHCPSCCEKVEEVVCPLPSFINDLLDVNDLEEEVAGGGHYSASQVNCNAVNGEEAQHVLLPLECNAEERQPCGVHRDEMPLLYCDTCMQTLCRLCTAQGEHSGHSLTYLKDAIESSHSNKQHLLTETQAGMHAVETAIADAQAVALRVNARADEVSVEVRTMIRRHVTALEEREKELLGQVEQIRKGKELSLFKQMEQLKTFLGSLTMILGSLKGKSGVREGEMRFLNAARDLQRIREQCQENMNPQEDDTLLFSCQHMGMLRSLSTLGVITISGGSCSSSSSSSSVNSSSPHAFHQEFSSSLVLRASDHLFRACTIGNCDLVSMNPEGFSGQVPIQEAFRTEIGFHAAGVPERIGKDYLEIGAPRLIFGGQGEEDGALCRPWGVCCDPEGNFIVADRSNNRVQVFHADGSFWYKFGSYGSRVGFFNRPAGVDCDPVTRNIVVVDKDNHRVQVFTHHGAFVLAFGERGGRDGQFNYPWDVAVGPSGKLLVSDTRNHRIQLFTRDGLYLTKFTYEGKPSRNFDSPRGVCFTPNGSMMVSDFNNHRVLFIRSDMSRAYFVGYEGTDCGQFQRPQGVAVDREGRIIVADSKNCRIQVLSPSGAFINMFGDRGFQAGEMDRPGGVCISPTGEIVVVDFGNNRVQFGHTSHFEIHVKDEYLR